MTPVIDAQGTGSKIKKHMQNKGMSAVDVQKELGLSSLMSVYFWFSGRNLPTLDNLVALAKLFECKIDDLLVVRWI